MYPATNEGVSAGGVGPAGAPVNERLQNHVAAISAVGRQLDDVESRLSCLEVALHGSGEAPPAQSVPLRHPAGQRSLDAPSRRGLDAPSMDHASKETPLLGHADEPDEVQPSIDHFFNSLDAALRVATACTLCSLFVLVPPLYSVMDANYTSQVASGVIVFIVFTAYKNLGCTIQLAWQGLFGTFAAGLFNHVLNIAMPDGARGHVYLPAVAHVANVAFICGALWLNVSNNVRMFMLSYHCYYMMEYMNPKSTSKWNTGIGIDFDSYTWTTTFVALWGVTVAVAAMLVPKPRLARADCENAANDMVRMTSDLVDKIVTYFMGNEKSLLFKATLADLDDLRAKINAAHLDLDGAWFEGFDLGNFGQVRHYLGRHLHKMKDILNTIACLRMVVAKEEFEDKHSLIMNTVRKEVFDLVRSTHQLLLEATTSAIDGRLDAAEVERLSRYKDETQVTIVNLSKQFDASRRNLFPNKVIDLELFSECYFVYCISQYAQYVVTYTESIINVKPRLFGLAHGVKDALSGLVDSDVLFNNKDHWSFTVRNSCSVLICYYLGFWLEGYNAVAAGTCSLLLSNYVGSAIVKNMGRLEGVVLGSVVPHILARVIGDSCSPLQLVASAVALFLWITSTYYIYSASPAFGSIACLAAAFGPACIIYPCGGEGRDATFKAAAFDKLTETAIATIVMTVVDTVLSPARASSMAIDNIHKAFVYMAAGFKVIPSERNDDGSTDVGVVPVKFDLAVSQKASAPQLLNKGRAVKPQANRKTVGVGVTFMERKTANIMTIISTAAQLAEEANKEPRYWRMAWPEGFFRKVVPIAQSICDDLEMLEDILDGSNDKFDDLFVDIRRLASFQQLHKTFLDHIADAIALIDHVMTSETGVSRKSMAAVCESMRVKQGHLENLERVLDDINQGVLKYPDEMCSSLEDDIICRVTSVLFLYTITFENVGSLMDTCITVASE